MGSKKVLMMANHGVLIATETIAEAFDFMYYVERAAEVTLKALSSGRPLKPIRDDVCKMTHDKFVLSGVAKVRHSALCAARDFPGACSHHRWLQCQHGSMHRLICSIFAWHDIA